MSEVTIEVEQRTSSGKNANRKLRAAGRIPAVVYGGGRPSVSIELGERALRDLLRKTSHEGRIFLLKLGSTGQSRHALIRDIEVDPISRKVIHVDFQRVVMDQPIRVTVPVHLTGTPVGVKVEGGLLDFVTRELHVECLPDKIPSELVVDVSNLHTGQHIEASQLPLAEGVVLVEEGSRVVVSVAGPRGLTAEEVAEDQLLAAEPAEPEVLTRRKSEE